MDGTQQAEVIQTSNEAISQNYVISGHLAQVCGATYICCFLWNTILINMHSNINRILFSVKV
jgi:hypothetical protein